MTIDKHAPATGISLHIGTTPTTEHPPQQRQPVDCTVEQFTSTMVALADALKKAQPSSKFERRAP